jgi:hypothetical protein
MGEPKQYVLVHARTVQLVVPQEGVFVEMETPPVEMFLAMKMCVPALCVGTVSGASSHRMEIGAPVGGSVEMHCAPACVVLSPLAIVSVTSTSNNRKKRGIRDPQGMGSVRS